MILVSVGTQLPFDRLIRAIDDIAPKLDEEIVAQIGVTEYSPANITFHKTLAPIAYEELVKKARVLVSHAGIGTILGAQKHEKPIVIFPRQAQFGEHRNDHQLSTCRQLRHYKGVYVAENEAMLLETLQRGDLEPLTSSSAPARRDGLIRFLRDFIDA
ncbi:MAG: glycosyltransferase [Pannonibacter sp.]